MRYDDSLLTIRLGWAQTRGLKPLKITFGITADLSYIKLRTKTIFKRLS